MSSQATPSAQLKASLAILKERVQQFGPLTGLNNLNSPHVIDLFIQNTPKGTLSKDDLFPPTMQALKKKYALEMSLPPERARPINRVEIIETLDVTQEQTDRCRGSLASNHGVKEVAGIVEIGVSQRYSSAGLEKLERIAMSDLLVRKMHEGRFLLCRTICPAAYDAGIGILLAVEDPQGDPAYIKLFNHPLLMDASCDELDSILIPVGTILAIREPFYVTGAFCGPAGLPFIKVDSPSDVFFVDGVHSILHDVSWKTKLVPPRPNTPQLPATGEEWKARGVAKFKEGRWFSSAVCFTKCIDSGFEIQISRLNRSEVYLRLGWNNSAYQDAKLAFESETLDDDLKRKAIVRMLKAQYALKQYDAVLEIAKPFPEDKLVIEWATKAEKRNEEKRSGQFDWVSLHKESNRPRYSPDIGDFVGPVKIGFREGPTRIRGTFVTRDVKVGELLMFQKPICSYWHEDDDNVPIQIDHVPLGKTCGSRAMYLHFSKVIQKMWDDKNTKGTVQGLHSDDDSTKPNDFPPPLETCSALEHPVRPVVDIDVEDIFKTVVTNSFGFGDEGQGLFGLASLLNHSCVPSAHRHFIGDAIAIRATRNLKKGEEVTIAYISPRSHDEKRIRLMLTWGFNCTCELCEVESQDHFDIRQKRRKLTSRMEGVFKMLNQSFEPGPLRRLAAKAKSICAEMKQAYTSDGPAYGITTKPELAEALQLYSSIVEMQGYMDSDLSFIKRAIELKMDSLEFDGLRVNDRSLSGPVCTALGKKKKKTRLPVDLSVLSEHHEDCLTTIFQIVGLLEVLGEKKRAQSWFDVALQMENLHKGGAKAVFKMLHERALTTKDLWKYL